MSAESPQAHQLSAQEFSEFIKRSARPSHSKKAQQIPKDCDSGSGPDLTTDRQTSSPPGLPGRITALASSDFPLTDFPHLSPCQREVLYWAAHGKSAWVTGKLLGLTEATVKSYISNACARLGADNKTHAVAISVHHGIIRLFLDTLNQ
jgi:DNA-binding CsgD family transcriptional regulator